ncbi:MAG: heme-binding protein [Burkholderiales bacterium]|nr:heme-binding protein [Burkholderiales bacterium]
MHKNSIKNRAGSSVLATAVLTTFLTLASPAAFADQSEDAKHADRADTTRCKGLPSHGQLKAALNAAVAADSTGLDNQMWGTIVDDTGKVCAVAFSGATLGAQWLASRVISAQKANTANSLSLDDLAFSTALLFSAAQPGGFLFGLQHSNPVDTEVAYKGPSANFGRHNDPMVGFRIGGINVFGGGLALYSAGHVKMGGVGVSGDTSCTDHFIAWRLRKNLNLDHLAGIPRFVSGDAARPDNIVFDITSNPGGGTGISAGGFGHPSCPGAGNPATLPVVVP